MVEIEPKPCDLDILLEKDIKESSKEKRYWVSWYTESHEGRLAWKLMRDTSRGKHFKSWLTGQSGDDDPEIWSICAEIWAHDETEVWSKVSKFWPNFEQRFINELPTDAKLSNRFQ